MKIPKFADHDVACSLIKDISGEFAIVQNPSYVYPPYEAYPLPPRQQVLSRGMAGAVMDMDGTTTTTEPLCIHSLATMVRRITGHERDGAWAGLNRDRDYPHIIGNSTTKHVEYLVRTFEAEIDEAAFKRFYLYAAAWTLGQGKDEGRRREVRNNLAALGLGALEKDGRFVALSKARTLDAPEAREHLEALTCECAQRLNLASFTDKVRAAVDVYYQRYHDLLGRIAEGEGDAVAVEVFGSADERLICPMTGIGVFLALVKGWLGAEAGFCFEPFAEHLASLMEEGEKAALLTPDCLPALGAYFERNPIAVAIVTSSIFYEANIVLGEVFRVLRSEVEGWAISPERKTRILEQFASPEAYYDGFITATDSSEIRLKPHRDLYSIALHQMGIHPEDFDKVVGFEDSESGTIAIRAAGIPCCCALPFPETKGHQFDAASVIAYGGIPEVVLRHRVFLPETVLG